MFNVYLDDGNIDVSKLDDICYIINKDGTFLRKKVGITDALIKVNNISHLPSSISTFGKINIPIIPQDHFSKVVKFFNWAYKKYNGESVVLIYYNVDTNDFDIFPTDQEVSSASANYTKDGLSHKGYLLVGTIHSHANFGAGHSGVDNDDELNFDGVHITVGNVDDTYQTISCSIVINGQRFMYDPEEYIDGVVKVNYNERPNHFENNFKFGTVTKSDNRYLVRGLSSAYFEENWKDKVQKRIRKQYKNRTFTYGYDGFNIHTRNQDFIDNFMNFRQGIGHDPFSYESSDKSIETQSPCANCIYRDFKSQELIQEILGDVFDEDEIRYFLSDYEYYDEDDVNNEGEGGDNE